MDQVLVFTGPASVCSVPSVILAMPGMSRVKSGVSSGCQTSWTRLGLLVTTGPVSAPASTATSAGFFSGQPANSARDTGAANRNHGSRVMPTPIRRSGAQRRALLLLRGDLRRAQLEAVG